ncbi:uncharacterized protein LOC107758956 [Nicotiana tabacum]|uniref:Uncharacterized protein LOC107758956 n=1 Tax=Nicotiana tabacum TaxID=4097 RepID=A0AC58TE10_TOBAC
MATIVSFIQLGIREFRKGDSFRKSETANDDSFSLSARTKTSNFKENGCCENTKRSATVTSKNQSVASECAFSTGGRILDSFRSSLTPKYVQALVCVQDWLREEKNPISVEEDLEYLEELELDMKNNRSTTSIV